MDGFQPVQRFLAVLALLEVEIARLGDGAQVLRQPLPFERGIAGTFAHAGGDGFGIDARTLQHLAEARLDRIVVEARQLVLSHVRPRIDAVSGRRVQQSGRAVPERIEMCDGYEHLGELALDLWPLGRGRPVDRRFDLTDVLRKLGDQLSRSPQMRYTKVNKINRAALPLNMVSCLQIRHSCH